MNNVETIKQPETALKVKKILVAVDLSPHSERTVDYAISIARQFGASLKVIHVYSPPASMEFGGQDICSLLEKDRQEKEGRLVSLANRVRDNYPDCEYLLRTGNPAEEVARAADIVGANLIVVGRHHETFLGHLLNLDQAPKIVHRAACPVLVWEDDDNGTK
jgi:nucleotide-binding universal stress UspA family protein